MRSLDVSLTRLEELRSIKDGWLDGECDRPNDEAIDKAEVVLRICQWLAPVAYIYPHHEGGVLLEWDIKLDDCTELHQLEFTNDKVTRYWYILDVDDESVPFHCDMSWADGSPVDISNTLDLYHC